MNAPYQDPNQRTYVATVMANPEVSPLLEHDMHTVVDALQANGAIIEDVIWLAEDEACDIFFAVLPLKEASDMLEHLLVEVPFDCVVQSAQGRKKKMLISDMDSTMIEQECIDELADFAGIKDKIAAITERAMNGELDFKEALRERVAMLEGLSEDVLQEAYNKHITLMPGGAELVATMKAQGARCILVSGGFTFFTIRVADALGFDVQEANILEVSGGKLTGKVQEPILDKEAKVNALRFHAEECGIRTSEILAIGDGANDLPMLLEAGLGVAYHAKPHVRAQAQAKINTCDLRAILYIQGYNQSEIVTGS